eukprot:102278_1
MSEKEFIEFAEKILQNEEMTQKYNWNSFADIKMKTLNLFKQYCEDNQINGNNFHEIPRKLFVNWMKKKHKILPGDSIKLFTILKKEIIAYNKPTLDDIENKQKQQTETFEVEYFLKLFHYFTMCRKDFVCINSLFDLPQNLRNVLLVSNENEEQKYHHNMDRSDEISLTKLTDIFSNVHHIAFTEIKYEDMVKYCGKLCKSANEYQENVNNENKKLNLVTFKSKNMNNAKYSTVLQNATKKYMAMMKNISIKYEF